MDAGKEKESSLNLTFLKKIPWLKILKMTVGAVLAMELAGLLHLEYAASAGVIAFLTIQDTRQETSSSALRRGIAFCIMTLLCLPIFSLLGNQPWAFGIFFPLFLPHGRFHRRQYRLGNALHGSWRRIATHAKK